MGTAAATWGGSGAPEASKDDARRQQQLVRLGKAVAKLRSELAANRDAIRRLLGVGRPLNHDEQAQWRALGYQAERMRRELAQLFAEFEEVRNARRPGQ